MNSISVKEVEYIAHRLAKELFSFNEPIPDFATRYPHRLEGCLGVPFLSFSGGSPYPTLILKASILFYLMIKNHPFQNGNKRIAMTTLFVFLSMNNKWIKVGPDELYRFTVWIAESEPKVKDATVQAIEKFISDYIIDTPKNS